MWIKNFQITTSRTKTNRLHPIKRRHTNPKGKASQVKPREAQEGTDAEAADRTNQGKGAIRCRLPSQRKDTSW